MTYPPLLGRDANHGLFVRQMFPLFLLFGVLDWFCKKQITFSSLICHTYNCENTSTDIPASMHSNSHTVPNFICRFLLIVLTSKQISYRTQIGPFMKQIFPGTCTSNSGESKWGSIILYGNKFLKYKRNSCRSVIWNSNLIYIKSFI